MGIEIVVKCARCDRELDVAPPLLFKHPVLEITVFRCACKDAQQAVGADAKQPCASCGWWKTREVKHCAECGLPIRAD